MANQIVLSFFKRYLASGKAIALLLALLMVGVTSSPVLAQQFPALTGRVVDQANLLDPAQESQLTAKLEVLEKTTTRQFVVATVSDLQDYEIGDYGYRLGRHWGIGQSENGDAEKNNGVILIIAPKERKMRIEVGYGLEPVLTDAYSSSIIRNDITPYFKAGDFAGGINAGADKIITQLQLPPEEAARIAQSASPPMTEASSKQSRGDNIGLILFWLFVLFFIILPIIRSARGGRKHRRSGSSGPVIIWGGGSDWGGRSGGSSWGGGGSSWGGGGFSGGGGSFGGGGASGGW